MEYQVFIPARGGSKRFPDKNIQILGNLSLVGHSIAYALKSFPANRIWVNSDDERILNEAKEIGVQTIKRPAELADDVTPTAYVSEFQISEFERLGIPCDAIILLQPTNPLRPAGLIEEAISKFALVSRQSLATFTPLNKKFGTIKGSYFHPTNYFPGQRMQDLEKEYFENGLLYITRAESIKKKVIITEDVFPLIVEHIFSQLDIDLPEDLVFAEFLLRNFRS